MKNPQRIKKSPLFLSLVISAVLSSTSPLASAALSTVQEFTNAVLPTGDWSIGSQSGGGVSVSTATTANLNGSSGSLKGTYPVSTGGVYVWGAYNLASQKSYNLYMDFWAKMPTAKQGLKFLKIFGGSSSSSNYANTTFALDYTGSDNGSMYQVSFGDGSSTGNDTGNVINFDGSYPNWIGRSYGKAQVSTPQKSKWASSNWGTSWHHFKIHAKFNSGTSAATEVADGEYYVEIDGKVYVDAKGLFNRHYSNAPIDRVELFGWAQGGTAPFELWYDNINISTTGFPDSSSTATPAQPMPPGNVSVEIQ